MRDIEFRARYGYEKKWVYGYYIRRAEPSALDEIVHHYIVNDKYTYNINGDTLGQYTGLKDKNGVKIYDGDKVSDGEYTYTIGYMLMGYDSNLCGLMGFGFIEQSTTSRNEEFIELQYGDSYKDLEVIGNIHD